ncbi:hypothetical protein AB4027_02945 [Alkalibacterium putridalgicola]|uniref:Host cell surface-exposed lipoprotein n=1 Tax=Alkalibacterium putridalgicola TaxID=426703 RepID=A0A1H7R2G0_9LACT|nr:hypothetical protein [Alkalibacterium putridalgicola]GEK89037.1 hypothetical protein APU01nite_10760 [Alkalibacterium putridalgicola]SEL54373.1 hypothetical protein SAMN04488100_10374 [Alkalibacterium putridalgicola]
MKNKRLILPMIALSLGLAACQDTTEDTGTETPTEETSDENGSTTDSATSGINDDEAIPTEGEPSDPDYALLEQAKEEYYGGNLDAASGTLSRLLQKDLSDKELLEAEAEDLKEEISQQQAEEASETAESQADSAFKEERQSALLSEEYKAATGKDLSEATDEEIEAWLTERDAEKNEPAQGETAGEESMPESNMTRAEAENYAFEQVIERAEIDEENYFYFVNYTEDNWVQVEARESVEQDGVTFSNLIGMYRYNVSTDEMQKLDVITGDYNTIEE